MLVKPKEGHDDIHEEMSEPTIEARYIRSQDNIIVDALSRGTIMENVRIELDQGLTINKIWDPGDLLRIGQIGCPDTTIDIGPAHTVINGAVYPAYAEDPGPQEPDVDAAFEMA